MTAHADIHRVHPRTHRRAVLLGAHIETLAEGVEHDAAQAIYDRVWQAMGTDEIADDRAVPDDVVRTRDIDADTEEEQRDHVLTTPEGGSVAWTRTERRLTEAGRARLEA